MVGQALYIFLIIMFSCFALLVFFSDLKGSSAYTKKRLMSNRYSRVTDFVKHQVKQEELDKLFLSAGVRFSSIYYMLIRYLLLFVVLFFLVYRALQSMIFPFYKLSLLLLVFFLTTPKTVFWGYTTPMGYIISILTSGHKAKISKEIYRAIIQLKNLSVSKKKEPIGSNYILNELMKFTKVTKPIFARTLSLWQIGLHNEACKYFAEATGTSEGRNLSNLFMKLDYLSPAELKEELELYQVNIKASRQTDKEKRQEVYGNIMYALVVISATLVLLNFAVVVLLLDSLWLMDKFIF